MEKKFFGNQLLKQGKENVFTIYQKCKNNLKLQILTLILSKWVDK